MSFASFFNDAKKKRENLSVSKRKINPGKSSQACKRKKKNNHNKNTKKDGNEAALGGTLSLLELVNNHENETRKRKSQYNSSQNRNKDRIVNPQALELSSTLKELSNQKQLKQALRLYNDVANENIRDAHHGSIMIDCCSRCGDIDQAENIFRRMVLEVQKRQKNENDTDITQYQISVQAYTALMKGYSHSGQMDKAAELYRTMCTFRTRYSRPNIRTFNTFLRGCLWTASSSSYPYSASKGGGVVSSEDAWLITGEGRGTELFDYSSYEYSINLLCQALRVQDASKRIVEMINNKFLSSGEDKSETLATSYVALARAHALLGNATTSRKNIQKALEILDSNGNNSNAKYDHTTKKQIKGAHGGKRAWKNHNTKNSGSDKNYDQIQNRSISNQLFRGHRKSELLNEAKALSRIKRCPSKKQVAQLMMTRLLYFCGGGTTDMNAVKERDRKSTNKNDMHLLAKDLLNTLWFCFGLSALVSKSTHTPTVGNSSYPMINQDNLNDLENIAKEFHTGNLLNLVFTSEGWMNFQHIFSPLVVDAKTKQNLTQSKSPKKEKPIYIELGAGSGDWIISQATANADVNYISVELRADRVAQTFAKATLNLNFIQKSNSSKIKSPLTNLCCCGSECGLFLRKHIPPRSISRIYVNHPEPPTQTGKDFFQDDENTESISHQNEQRSQEEESAHMLNSSVLNAALNCLKDDGNGEFIIVTDNRWYAFFICRTIINVIKDRNAKNEKVNFKQMALSEPSLRPIEMFSVQDGRNKSKGDNLKSTIMLYEGQPCSAIGHTFEKDPTNSQGTSYFDRLWRTGAGRHAEMKSRYIIALRTNGCFKKEMTQPNSNMKENILKEKSSKKKKTAGKQTKRKVKK